MDNRTGEIAKLEEFKEKYGELTNDLTTMQNEITELTDKEHKVLQNIKESDRPAELAWLRFGSKYLPSKLIFKAGYEAAKKIYENNGES